MTRIQGDGGTEAAAPSEGTMTTDNARYAMAAATSATIVNLLSNRDDLTATQLFERVLHLILEADRELERIRLEPSLN